MIKKIKIYNDTGNKLILDMTNPYESGIYISDIDGLGPVKAEIHMSESSTSDGGEFSSARVNIRNIVLTLGFITTESVEITRIKTYKYLPVKKKVRLVIETDVRTLETYGYVESNEPVLFSKNQNTRVSILCEDPYFHSLTTNVTVFSGVESMFEFPFSNESLTEDLLIVSELRLEQEQTVFYTGDSEVGIQISIHALGPVENLEIHNAQTRESMRIDHDKLVELTGFGIIQSDDIVITTYTNSKTISLYREGVHYNILNSLGRDTDWFKLQKGDNVFLYTADTGDKNLQFRITNKITYEGV